MEDKRELRRLVGVIAEQIGNGTLFNSGFYSKAQLSSFVKEAHRDMQALADLRQIRSLEQWDEEQGNVLWWRLPVDEPPYVGTPLDSNWPGYHTHWTPIQMPAL